MRYAYKGELLKVWTHIIIIVRVVMLGLLVHGPCHVVLLNWWIAGGL